MTAAPSLREKRREKRKAEILDVALAVFGEKGYAGASMDEIAEQALLTRVALYKYFPDKATLLVELRLAKFEELAGRAEAALAGDGPPEARLHAALREIADFQERHAGFFRVLFAASLGPALKTDPAFKRFMGAFEAFVARGQAEGRLRPGLPPEILAGLLVSMAFTPSLKRNLVLSEGEALPHDFTGAIVDLFLHGTARPDGGAP